MTSQINQNAMLMLIRKPANIVVHIYRTMFLLEEKFQWIKLLWKGYKIYLSLLVVFFLFHIACSLSSSGTHTFERFRQKKLYLSPSVMCHICLLCMKQDYRSCLKARPWHKKPHVTVLVKPQSFPSARTHFVIHLWYCLHKHE